MPIEALDPKNSVLFLGSGFSSKAKNIMNEELPAGQPLLERLTAAIEELPTDHDLKSAADAFSDRFDLSIYDILYNTFTVSAVLEYQKDILSLPWARIYTTNYDDMVNFVKGPSYPIFAFDDPRPRSLPQSFAVYLHGSIRKASEENAESQLILNSRSYDLIARDHPTWFYEFQRDRRTFDACFFMGFSLGDHHITGLMAAGEISASHTHFITRNPPNASLAKRAPPYGTIEAIGFDGFAALSKSLPPPPNPANLQSLQSFKHLRRGIDAKPLVEPTPVEVINLVTFGTFNQSRFFNTKGDDSYVTRRSKAVESALNLLKTNRTVLVHSRLGNGKSIFTSILARAAKDEGYKCFQWRRAGRRLAQDLEVIRAEGRALIIFDDYDAAIDNIGRIAADVPEAKFVVTIRSGQQEVRLHEVVAKLPQPLKRVNLDPFDDEDKAQLRTILNRAGARSEGFDEIINSSHEIRDIVTQLYNHAKIRDNIALSIQKSSPEMVRIITLASLVKWAGVEIDDGDLQKLADCDVYLELRKSEGIGTDFLSQTDDRVEMRSGLLSEYLIQRILPPKQVLDSCYAITTASTRRKTDRVHRRLAAELMKFSTLQRFMKFHKSADGNLERHYTNLSNDKDVNEEPLFWLQFAIFMKTTDITKARYFLNTSYERAEEKEGFKTFQLDTQALSIYLLEEIQSNSSSVEGLENILAAIKTVSDMITDQSHRQYAIEVIGEIPAFLSARQSVLKNEEKVALVFELNRVSKALAALSVEDKAYSGSEIVRTQLDEAVSNMAKVSA